MASNKKMDKTFFGNIKEVIWKMKKKEYAEAGILYFIATLFNKGIGFVTVPIFSRILTTTDYGTVTTFNSWVSMVSVFISLALYNAVRNSFVDMNEKERPHFLSTIITFTVLIFFVVMGVCLSATIIIPKNINMALVYMCVVQSFGYALINDYSYYLMMSYRYRYRAALMVLPGLISVILSICSILFIVKERLYLGRIVPTTLVYAAFAIIILISIYSKIKPEINIKYLKYGLVIALPLVLHSIALQILSQSDRVMITSLRSASETGIYSLVYNLSMIATVITTSLDGIWVPWFTERLKKREICEINTVAIDYVHLMTYAMIGLILVGPEILKIFADQRYWEGMSIIPPIALANYMIFMYTMYVYIEHYYKKTVYITKNTLIAAGLNVLLNFIFIPQFGYVAAAYTTLISYFVAFVLHSRYAKQIEPNIYPLKMFVAPLLQVAVAIAIYYPLLNFWILRGGILVIYLIFVLIKERYRIGVLIPGISDKCSFFRKKSK